MSALTIFHNIHWVAAYPELGARAAGMLEEAETAIRTLPLADLADLADKTVPGRTFVEELNFSAGKLLEVYKNSGNQNVRSAAIQTFVELSEKMPTHQHFDIKMDGLSEDCNKKLSALTNAFRDSFGTYRLNNLNDIRNFVVEAPQRKTSRSTGPGVSEPCRTVAQLG